MPLYQVDFTAASAVTVQPVSYATEGILERQNLQKLIAANLACLGDDLLLITQSFKELEGSLREVDILALDKEANLVIIELKRTEGGEYADLQAIRYAGMLSSLDFEAVAKIHAGANKKETYEAEQIIRDFLGAVETDVPIISDKPRIYLIAPSFSKELAMTCLWLIRADIDIRCIKASLYKIGTAYHMDIEQELPQPTAEQYQYRLRTKQIQREAVAVKQQLRKRANWAVPALQKNGILTPGTKLCLRPYKHYFDSVPESDREAIFHDKSHDGIEWKGQKFNLSTLTAHIFDVYAKTQTKINPTEAWQIDGDSVSLYHRSAALSESQADLTVDLETEDTVEIGMGQPTV